MATIPITCIVLARNAEKTLRSCLESVLRNNPTEIIVVDGMSRDRTKEIAKAFTNTIISDEGQGVSAAHQLGLEKAGQSFISFIDADIVLPDGALETMLAELKSTGFANLQARLVPQTAETYWQRAQDAQIRARQARTPGGLAACVIPTDVARKVGFDAGIYIAGDDLDFLYRLKRAGYKAGISTVNVAHKHRVGFQDLVRQKFWYGRAKPALIRKHGPFKGELWAPAVMAYWLAVYIIKGRWNLIPYVLVSGIADSAGMVKGVFELHRGTPK
jgi:glycosyltransferase involved in cell wall biosynthesis